MNTYPDLDFFEAFPWNKGFELGIPAIDDQHKQLIVLINRLVNTLIHNKPMEINDAFSELAEYADFHFVTEEAIWAEHLQNDDWVASHRHNHASFLPAVKAIQEKEEGKPLPEVIEKILRFLTRWLAFHIIDDDKRLAIAVKALESGANVDEAKKHAELEMDSSINILIDIVLTMYDGLSSRTLNLMRERQARIAAESELKQANLKLAQLSITDQLTGLYNRRHFDEVLDVELKGAIHTQSALNFFLLDIDFFKRLNDRYGHQQGDIALQQVAQQLQSLCQHPSEYAFRLGGEEFAIVSVTTTENDPLLFAKAICDSISALAIENKDSDTADILTVSVGMICGIPQPTENRDKLMQQADRCLYFAKRNGRNQVISPADLNEQSLLSLP
ncbi:GGDEF domain-containing protein [Amphritea japonica]|uniref:diguanylate cyclase n=1 Tax=Amphritea japonica ATCC BAA-1530 TaxID=1278309 RepID=A0A7R6PGL4_9GAMM|nr:diguanylate cyclase [Amphritea japonica]BBB27881.1 signal transduction protein [Amphritea japonica ATCC BAA-1530]